MTRSRVRALMRRAGVQADPLGPLSQVKTVEELHAAVASLSDSQLVDAWVATMSDDEILARLETARAEPVAQED